jgi:hypothetical protein
MAIDLKTETPDGSLPSDGFLFGADSQSAAAPSVYTTQAVATTLLGSTSLTGATLTASSPVLDLSQTWNNAAVTFTGLRFNATDTASASGSLLMDLQAGGATRAGVLKSGVIYSVTQVGVFSSSNYQSALLTDGVSVKDTNSYGFSSTNSAVGSRDLFLTRRAAANLRLGAADAAAPVAQTLSVQSVSSGTSNTAGQNFTITGSQGTGNAAGGSIVFQVAPAGSSGTAQNALVDALTIGGDRIATFARSVVSSGSTGYNGALFGPFGTFGAGMRWIENVLSIHNSASGSGVGANTIGGTIGGVLAFGTSVWNNLDTILTRDAANTLALRNGTNAQTFNIYNTYTDASNYERGFVSWSVIANQLHIGTQAAGTGAQRATVLSGGEIYFRTGATARWYVTSTGQLYPLGDNVYDVGGAAGARVRNLFLAGYSQLSEVTAPAAPAANEVRIYAEDDGAGKTRLMALFATGAAVQIAIEP